MLWDKVRDILGFSSLMKKSGRLTYLGQYKESFIVESDYI